MDDMLSPPARAVAALIALATAVSLAAQFVAVGLDHPEYSHGETLWRLARYFTILTNLMVAVTYAALALSGRVGSPVWLGGVTLWIVITGVVYHLLLAATDTQDTAVSWYANIGLHSVVPGLVALWWLAAGPREGLGIHAALLWLLWPLLYVCYALLRGQIDGTYPYFFTDPTRIGWQGVGMWTLILAGAFFAAGLLQIALARLLRNR